MIRVAFASLLSVWIFFSFKNASAQMEFVKPGEKALIPSASFSTTPAAPIYGGEIVYTNDGRVGIGGLFASGGSPNSDAAGVEFLGSILSPENGELLGLEVLASFAYTWMSISGPYPGSLTQFTGNTIVVGAEAYGTIGSDSASSRVQPFIQVARSFATLSSGGMSAKDDFNTVGVGCNILAPVSRSADFAITPGVIFHENRTDFGISVSLAFRMN